MCASDKSPLLPVYAGPMNGTTPPRGRESPGPLREDPNESYLYTLHAASEGCVECCAILQRVAPELSLKSPFARDVHTLLYLVGNVEVALHQFVDRELLDREPWVRRREQGARLQDALERSRTTKATVKASLLAGGIASLLHLFALTLRRLNEQLERLLAIEQAGNAYPEIAATIAAAYLLRRVSRSHVPHARTLTGLLGTGCGARALLLRLRRRHAVEKLHATQVHFCHRGSPTPCSSARSQIALAMLLAPSRRSCFSLTSVRSLSPVSHLRLFAGAPISASSALVVGNFGRPESAQA
jgi:hypothetical protein